jgi:hypothetical protein
MKEQLIEKLKDSRDHIKGRTQSINVALKFEELEWLLQALTSVKSAEEVLILQKALNEYINLKHTQEECTGFIDGYNQAMHDFANNSEAIKENAIKFAKYITNNKNNEWDKLYNIYLTNKEK